MSFSAEEMELSRTAHGGSKNAVEEIEITGEEKKYKPRDVLGWWTVYSAIVYVTCFFLDYAINYICSLYNDSIPDSNNGKIFQFISTF